MKFGILNVLLATATVALTCALVANGQQDSVVRIGSYYDWWGVSSREINNSRWPDSSKPPDFSQLDAFQIGESICQHLNDNSDRIGSGDWDVGSISFERLASARRNQWVYLVRVDSNILDEGARAHLTFLVLMDGTVLFGAAEYKKNIVEVLMEYPDMVDGSSVLSILPNWCPLP